MTVIKRDFLDTTDLSQAEFHALLDLAAKLKRGETTAESALRGKVLAMVFMDPSLRTRTSFEVAMFRHGGHAVVLEPGRGSWTLETELGAVMDGASVEHIVDAARVLGRYADAVAVRAFPKGKLWEVEREDAVMRSFARHCEKPLINLESTRRHPCQGLADALTLREKLGQPQGRRFVLSWSWHPKPLPTAVPASAALAAAHLGMEVVLAHPPGFELDPDDMAAIAGVSKAAGGSLRIDHNGREALDGADVVYVKSWGALGHFGQPEAEAKLRAAHRDWSMNSERLRHVGSGQGLVMHCLPVRRNIELSDAILDGPKSVVVDQAENRLHVQRALLLTLLGQSEGMGVQR